MQLKLAAALVFATAMLPAAARAASVDGSIQRSLIANYASRCTAAFDPSEENRDATFAFLAPDFGGIDLNGQKVGRREFIAVTEHQMKMVQATVCYNKIESFTPFDANTIIVANAFHLEGRLLSLGAKHDLVVTKKSQDTWTNVDGEWLESQITSSQVFLKIDGSLVDGALWDSHAWLRHGRHAP
jgi:hypothetical protein